MTSGGVEPQPEAVGSGGLLISRPKGNVSVREKLVRFVLVGAVTWILNLEVPPAVIELGMNDFDASKSVPKTVTFAFAARRFPTP